MDYETVIGPGNSRPATDLLEVYLRLHTASGAGRDWKPASSWRRCAPFSTPASYRGKKKTLPFWWDRSRFGPGAGPGETIALLRENMGADHIQTGN